MLGRICWGSGRKVESGVEQIHGLSVLTVRLPQLAHRPERAVRKGAGLLRRNGVRRVLVPPDFPWWSELVRFGLRPVETRMLRCMLAPVWVTARLKRQSIPPERAVLCLKGEKSDPTLEQLARELCPLVRGLVFKIPGGNRTADRLRREMGIPVLPSDYGDVHLTLQLDEGPVLTGAEISLPGRELPPDCDRVSLIGALWENGRIRTEEIALKL